MKKMLLLLLVLACSSPQLQAQSVDDFFGSMNNSGTDFWMSFPACYEPGGGGDNNCRIYVYSPVEQEIAIEIAGRGLLEKRTVHAQSVEEIILEPYLAQVYTKLPNELPPDDQVWQKAAVNVRAETPVCVQGVTRFNFTSDGFTALPTHALGQEYVVSSYADMSGMYAGLRLPSELCVVAVEDNTIVQFTLGGNSVTETAGGTKPGQTKSVTLHKGDVYAVSTITDEGDLSGSKIVSNKPVGVISGNQCANIPTTIRWCDFIVEMQSPIESWGTEYHVTKMHGRKNNSMIKIYAKEDNTTIYRNGKVIGLINSAPGIESVAYLHMRVAPGDAGHYTISGNKPIYVTQFNPGQEDDNVVSDPFQLDLYSTSQYGKIAAFTTPGITGGGGFDNNYVNLTYQSTNGTIPAHLEFAEIDGTTATWQSISTAFNSTPGDPIGTGGMWWVKELLLPAEGVYAIRSETDFGAVSYGFSNYDSYAFPTIVGTNWQGIEDNQAPDYTIVSESGAYVDLELHDIGEAGLAFARMDDAASSNSRMVNYVYTPSSGSATCRIEFLGQQQSVAVLKLVDRAGNSRIVEIEGEGCQSGLSVLPGVGQLHDFEGQHKLVTNELEFTITNSLDYSVGLLDLAVEENSRFSIENTDVLIPAGETHTFTVHFREDLETGVFTSNVIAHDSCGIGTVLAEISVEVVAGTLEYFDTYVFQTGFPGEQSERNVRVRGGSKTEVTIYDLEVISDNGEFFTEFDMSELPVVLQKDEFLDIPVVFAPTHIGIAHGELRVTSDAEEMTSTIDLLGDWVSPSVEQALAAQGLEVEVVPHPANSDARVLIHSTQPQSIEYSWFDVLGNQVSSSQEVNVGTMLSISLPDDLQAGWYTFSMVVRGRVYNIPVIVE